MGDPKERIGERLYNGRYKLLRVVGVGTYGAVYLARDLRTADLLAIKCLYKTGLTPDQLALQKHEVLINERLSNDVHPNIVGMVHSFEDPDCLYLVLEYYGNGDLYDEIDKYDGLSDEMTKYYFEQILDAVDYCHQNHVYYRDLKPENVLLCDNYIVKLCDFGLATFKDEEDELGCGSPPYMSPECLTKSGNKTYRAETADIWSLGILLFNMRFHRLPWREAHPSDPDFYAYTLDPYDFFKSRFFVTDEFCNLLLGCLDVDPARRWTIAELKAELRHIEQFLEEEETVEEHCPIERAPTTSAVHNHGPAKKPGGWHWGDELDEWIPIQLKERESRQIVCKHDGKMPPGFGTAITVF